MKKVVITGSGFAGLSAACFLAKAGAKVTVLEKNDSPGGRARSFSAKGFSFDMGPSWYWMPDVFDRFFEQFGKKTSDYYLLKRLDPSYRVFWQDEPADIPASFTALKAVFEQYEPGAGARLEQFLDEAAYKYDTAMKSFVYKPSLSFSEYIEPDVVKSLFRIDLLSSIHKHVRKYFSHPKLLQLAEFPILFLGALPRNTPALYSLMNYADMKLGTWYPQGGMYQIVHGMYQLAQELGVAFRFGEAATAIEAGNGAAKNISTKKGSYHADAFIAACDYHHAEQLLPESLRNYAESYWEQRKMAPSCLIYYVGLNREVPGLLHHNLFFDADFEAHADALYTRPRMPEDPLMYVCCPSKSDDTVAPPGCENLFILIPIAPGLKDYHDIRDQYFNIAINRLEQKTGQDIAGAVVYKRSYAHDDFLNDYNSYKGNAYGLANTLMQTAFLKPAIKNKKLRNLFYAGQLTVPGPGVPPALISGEIVAKELLRTLK